MRRVWLGLVGQLAGLDVAAEDDCPVMVPADRRAMLEDMYPEYTIHHRNQRPDESILLLLYVLSEQDDRPDRIPLPCQAKGGITAAD